MTTHLVTFSDESMSRSRELCAESAMRHGCVSAGHFLAEEWLDGDALKSRGLGYWAWKPKVILHALTADTSCVERAAEGNVVIYSDAGVEFINNVNFIIDRMDQDIFLFGNQWEHAHWCKGDVLCELWREARLNLELPVPERRAVSEDEMRMLWLRFGKQVQASVIFVRVSDYSRKFVAEWLDWCLFEGGRLIDDSPSRTPNHPEFREHRHDQAILTTMAYREGIRLHWWPASYNDGAFIYERGDYPDEGYPVMFNHHRKRNHEWEAVA